MPVRAGRPPPGPRLSHCNNGTCLGVAAIVCEIDINDDGVLNGDDVKVIIPISRGLSDNEINILTAPPAATRSWRGTAPFG